MKCDAMGIKRGEEMSGEGEEGIERYMVSVPPDSLPDCPLSRRRRKGVTVYGIQGCMR